MSDELKQATESLRILLSECGAVLKRAEAAEAEVAAIKRSISDPENQPSQFGTVLVSMLDEANKRADKEAAGWKSCREAYTRESLRGAEWLRRMMDAEAEVARLKALLEAKQPAEAPAAPRVLPEHLAWIEASAKLARFEFATKVDPDEKKECVAEALLAAHTLRAAVARRDGGAK